MMRKALIVTALLLVVVVAIGAIFGGVLWGRLHDPYQGYEGDEQFVVIARGTGTAAIGRRLVEAGVIRDESIQDALWWNGRAQSKGGEYRLTAPGRVDVVERWRGSTVHARIPFPEGLTIASGGIDESRGWCRGSFLEAAANASLSRDWTPEGGGSRGVLFRKHMATRNLPHPTDRLMTTAFERLPDEWRAKRGAGGTPRQVVTLASLVEKEKGKATSDDRRRRLSDRLSCMGLSHPPCVRAPEAGRYTAISGGTTGARLP